MSNGANWQRGETSGYPYPPFALTSSVGYCGARSALGLKIEIHQNRVWLKSPPTQPTVISSPYQLNKQIEQSGEFISIKWMFSHFWSLFGWSSRLKWNANYGEQEVYVYEVPALVRVWPVRTNKYSRWCRWWLESNRPKSTKSNVYY